MDLWNTGNHSIRGGQSFMKRKWILWIGIPVVVLLAVVVGVFIRVQGEISQMTPVETMKVTDGIYAVLDDMVNLYLVEGDTGFVAIDAGTRPENVKRELEKIHVSPEAVHTVFLTHSDWDHTGGVSLFTKGTVWLSTLEEPLIDGRTRRMWFAKNQLNCDYRLFRPDQRFEVDGLKIQCISAPGHTPGSTWFLVNDRYLFVGDGMCLKDGQIGVFSETFNMDSEMQAASFEKLTDFPNLQYLLTGHFGVTDYMQSVMESIPSD